MKKFIVGACIALTGCGALKLDSGVTWAPDFIKQAPPSPSSSVSPDPRPDVPKIVGEQGPHAFSNLRAIQVSEPFPDGSHWRACARVYSLGVTGTPVTGTYTFQISAGAIQNPRIDASGRCANKTYRPVSLR